MPKLAAVHLIILRSPSSDHPQDDRPHNPHQRTNQAPWNNPDWTPATTTRTKTLYPKKE